VVLYPRPASPCLGHRTPRQAGASYEGAEAIARKLRPETIVSRLLKLVEQSLDDDKAEEIVTINLAGKSAIADYLVIANGRSQRQVGAIADHLVERLKGSKLQSREPRVEGMPQNDWVLVDAGDIIVHVFRPEVRGFYNLEKMWSADTALSGEAVPA